MSNPKNRSILPTAGKAASMVATSRSGSPTSLRAIVCHSLAALSRSAPYWLMNCCLAAQNSVSNSFNFPVTSESLGLGTKWARPFKKGNVLPSIKEWARPSINDRLAVASLGRSRLWPRLMSRSETLRESSPRSSARSFLHPRQNRTETLMSTPSRVSTSRSWFEFSIMLFSKVAIGLVALPHPQKLHASADGQEGHQVRPDKVQDCGNHEQDDQHDNKRWRVSQEGNASFLLGKVKGHSPV